MKLLICSLTYPLLNGVTASINETVTALKEEKIESLIISPDYDLGKVREEHMPVSSSAITRRVGQLLGKNERTFGIMAHEQIKKIDAEFKPDAYWLHSVTPTVNAFEQFMSKSKKPKILSYHTLVEEYGRIYGGVVGAKIMRARSRAVCDKVDLVITPSGVIKELLISYGIKKQIEVVPTGISIPKKQLSREELQKRFRIEKDSKIILSVGRVSKEKKIDSLIRIVKELNQSGLKATLLLVGPGEKSEFKEEARELGIENRVIFTGGLPREDAGSLYGGSDIFLFASQTETQGLVVGEAMMAGVPIVALSSPIQKEVYPNEVAFIANNLKELKEKVFEALTEEERRLLITKKAREFVEERFSLKKMKERQIELISSL